MIPYIAAATREYEGGGNSNMREARMKTGLALGKGAGLRIVYSFIRLDEDQQLENPTSL